MMGDELVWGAPFWDAKKLRKLCYRLGCLIVTHCTFILFIPLPNPSSSQLMLGFPLCVSHSPDWVEESQSLSWKSAVSREQRVAFYSVWLLLIFEMLWMEMCYPSPYDKRTGRGNNSDSMEWFILDFMPLNNMECFGKRKSVYFYMQYRECTTQWCWKWPVILFSVNLTMAREWHLFMLTDQETCDTSHTVAVKLYIYICMYE